MKFRDSCWAVFPVNCSIIYCNLTISAALFYQYQSLMKAICGMLLHFVGSQISCSEPSAIFTREHMIIMPHSIPNGVGSLLPLCYYKSSESAKFTYGWIGWDEFGTNYSFLILYFTLTISFVSHLWETQPLKDPSITLHKKWLYYYYWFIGQWYLL